jgi:hypothetical protein
MYLTMRAAVAVEGPVAENAGREDREIACKILET